MKNFAERHYGRLIFAIWLITSLLFLFAARDNIAGWKMGDPDDQLRLVQVRDWLAGQGWSDVTQYRMNLPDGGPMHWSRLVDIPIAAAILALRPILGQYYAEMAAAAIVPLLIYGLFLAFYAAAVRRIWGALPALVAAASVFLIPQAVVQLVPMRIDHHGWQLVLFAVGLWALFDPRQSKISAAILGTAMALWLEISIEGLPFAVIFIGILALRWLIPSWRTAEVAAGDTDGGEPLLVAAVTFAASLATLFAITENWANAAEYCDGLSPFHVASATAVAGVLAIGAMLLHGHILKPVLSIKLAICASAALAGAATLLSMAPQCAGDAFATLDPLVRSYWFNRGVEGLPLWKLPFAETAPPLAGLIAGVLACIWMWLTKSLQPQSMVFTLLLLFIGPTLVGSFVNRTIVYALLVGAMLLAAMAVSFFTKAEDANGLSARMGWRLAGILLLMPAMLGQNASALPIRDTLPLTKKQRDAQADFLKQARQCQSTAASVMLKQLPTANIMAPLDTSPSILMFTQHRVVATGHHRNEAAMADVIRTFTGSADDAAAVLTKRRIDFVLTCDGSFEIDLYVKRMPSGFAAQLRQGTLPVWLKQQPDIGPFHLYKIDWSKS
ncbi:MAG: hypothetical protein ABL928_08880 [Sphingorhabdus sp.]